MLLHVINEALIRCAVMNDDYNVITVKTETIINNIQLFKLINKQMQKKL